MLTIYGDSHILYTMNIDKFRTDFKNRLEETGRSLLSVSRECAVDQSSLWRFLYSRKGLRAETAFAIWPFVYGEDDEKLG